MTVQEYIDQLNIRFKAGNSTEHTFRGDLQTLLESINPEILATNEPKRIQCGAPDYILTKNNIPVGYIEAKDLGNSLISKEYKEQFDRYKRSLPNLMFTNYIDFMLYHKGELVTTISIAEVSNGKVVGNPDKYEEFTTLIKDFSTYVSQSITSPIKLSGMMAGKARLMAVIIENAIISDEKANEDQVNEAANNSLRDQFSAFQHILIHDISPKGFADIYAQTIAYGMFAARLHDTTLDDFSRQEAAELIPKTNPFLRRLFQYIAGYDLDDRIKWIVDALADIFRATDVAKILQSFGKATQQNDPIVHFYETFLAEYDPKLRKSRGVWYTPEPVVNFIVRAVDDILKQEFGIKDGLADTSKTKVKVKVATKATADKRSKTKIVEQEKEVHKVQILDPATGTGTFLAEIVKHIYKKFEGQQGIWSQYVENHLIPRLNGFEILMASYAMAHLKLDLLFAETGFKPKKEQRFRVYLTNSLEEHHPDTGTLFASWLSSEANEANHIKRDTPVMVVLGNPPYSGESQNKGDWIMNLLEDYKKEPGGKEKLKERNPKWINDDYVKFLRYGQNFIEKNKEGILAFINPHGFLDNPTFRGMRWHLLKTYDKIYTIDLHGNSKKKEVCPDGSPDVNVFDIMQGVSINLMIKTGKKKDEELGQVFHYDLYGKREDKYDFLRGSKLDSIKFTLLKNKAPMYFMVAKNFENENRYNKGFSCNELFSVNGVGMTTAHDNFVIKDGFDELLRFYEKFQSSERDAELLHEKFQVKKKNGWNILDGYDNIKDDKDLTSYVKPLSYRPFDNKHIFYEDKLVWRTVRKVMNHLLNGDNLGLIIGRQGQVVGSMPWNLSFITKHITDFNFYYRGGGVLFPLYLYDGKDKELFDKAERTPNLKQEIVDELAQGIGITYTKEKEKTKSKFAPIDVLDYIYAILHSPSYRDKYKEFLKVDFPRIPYPKDRDTFWKLVNLGGELRGIHLLESSKVEKYITKYPKDGDNTITRSVGKKDFKITNEEKGLGQLWINDEQYFDKVPVIAWEFYIGGYQPAQKWLKDRKERHLSFEDIQHYQKIIVALSETDRIMKEIDKVKFKF